MPGVLRLWPPSQILPVSDIRRAELEPFSIVGAVANEHLCVGHQHSHTLLLESLPAESSEKLSQLTRCRLVGGTAGAPR